MKCIFECNSQKHLPVCRMEATTVLEQSATSNCAENLISDDHSDGILSFTVF